MLLARKGTGTGPRPRTAPEPCLLQTSAGSREQGAMRRRYAVRLALREAPASDIQSTGTHSRTGKQPSTAEHAVAQRALVASEMDDVGGVRALLRVSAERLDKAGWTLGRGGPRCGGHVG